MSEDFKESLKTNSNKQNLQKSRELDAYRKYIVENMPAYILFMEAINQTITLLEKKRAIGKTKIKTRIKAANSALINSEKKELDDIFGFEIITKNEKDKEIIMLIIHNLFEERYVQEKNHNKSNGYIAHHCVGAVKNKIDGSEIENLETHILTSKTKQLKHKYRDFTKQQQQELHKSELFEEIDRYPILKKELLNNNFLNDKIQQAFSDAMLFLNRYLLSDSNFKKNIPVIEIQFKTAAVEQEIISGNAQHIRYKIVDVEEIKRKYEQRQLVRGIDFPFIFFRNMETDEMELESTTRSLLNMWPFLKETVVKYKREHKTPVASYDMYLAKVFKDLEPYVIKLSQDEPMLPIKNTNPDNIWDILKAKIINKDFVLPEYNLTEEGKKERGVS